MSDPTSNPSDQLLILTLNDAPPPRLDKALAAVVPEGVTLSRSMITKLIESGAVARVGGDVVTKLKTKGKVGEEWQVILPKPVSLEAEPEDIPIEVIYEDDDLILVNKAAGMVVHPAPGSETGTLVNALLHHCADSLSGVGGMKRPGIVHRIDKDTSGLLVVAKNDIAHQGLAAQFAKHTIERRYIAFTNGAPNRSDPRIAGLPGVAFEEGGVIRVATNIARHKTDRKRMAVVTDAGRHSITRMRLINSYGPVERLYAGKIECWLETGRTHQIRVHASHIGHGLIGDPIYGRRKTLPTNTFSDTGRAFLEGFNRQALHAATIGFIHPISKKLLRFSSELPRDLKQLELILSE